VPICFLTLNAVKMDVIYKKTQFFGLFSFVLLEQKNIFLILRD